MEQVETKKKIYKNANLFKRICASLIDVIVVLFLIVGLYKLVFDPIINNCTDLNEISEKYSQKLAKTHLFIVDGTSYQLISEEKYGDNLEYYYHTYLDGVGDTEPGIKYDESRQESGLFNYVDGKYEEKNNVLKSKIDDFYEKQYEIAVTHAKSDSEINSYAKKMNYYNYGEFFITLFISSFIVLFAVPLWMLPNGKTIGKLCLSISVIDSRSDIMCSKKQIAIRQGALLIVELALSMITLFIPLLISIGFVVFTENKIALHDYFSVTYAIDDKHVVLFKTKKELDDFIKEKETPYYKTATYEHK